MNTRASIASVLLALSVIAPVDAAPTVSKAKPKLSKVTPPDTLPATFLDGPLTVGVGTKPGGTVMLSPMPKATLAKVKGLHAKLVNLPPPITISSADAQTWMTEIDALLGTPTEWASTNAYGGNSYREVRQLALLDLDPVYFKIVMRTGTTKPGEEAGQTSWSDWSMYIPLAQADLTLDTSDGLSIVATCHDGAKCILEASGQVSDTTTQRVSAFRVPGPIAAQLEEAVEQRLRLLSLYAANRKK